MGLNTVKTVPKLIRNAALKRKFCLNELKRSLVLLIRVFSYIGERLILNFCDVFILIVIIILSSVF